MIRLIIGLLLLISVAGCTGSLFGSSTDPVTNTLAYARTAEVTQGEAPDIPYVGTDCADPNNTTGVATNWVFEYTGEPIENVVQLLSGPGDSQWFFAFDNRCDNENHWPLGVERIDTFNPGARYRFYVAPYPQAELVSGQTFRVIVDGVDTGAVYTVP
jgi:hypothetical protein